VSWQNETRDVIVFKSPSARKKGESSLTDDLKAGLNKYNPLGGAQSGTFECLWRNNKRSFERKLGQFDPPKFKGTIVQDLEPKSTLWPLTVYFDGINHQRDAANFYDELFKESGDWEVVHPVHGTLILHLISAEESTDPVESGNYTQFDTQWIEPANAERVVSLEETLLGTLAKIMNVAEDCMTMLTQLRTDIFSNITAALGTFNKISGFMSRTISGICATVTMARNAFDDAKATFNGALSAFDYSDPDTTDMSAAMTNMSLAPLDGSTDYQTRSSAYSALADEIFTLAPATTTEEDHNKVVVIEFGATLTLMAAAQIAATSQYQSRSEVIAAIDGAAAFFNSVVARIEAIQDMYSELDIERQYFSQTATYTNLIQLYTLVFQYLLAQFYNLKTEKRFRLKKARSPLEIAVTEYQPNIEDIDYYHDLFIRSNNLHGNDILILPAGREVIIYA